MFFSHVLLIPAALGGYIPKGHSFTLRTLLNLKKHETTRENTKKIVRMW